MGSFSDYAEKKLLDQVFGATAWAAPATLYLGLFTANPDDTGGGTEVSGGSYARVPVTNNTTNFTAATGSGAGGSTKVMHVAQTFAAPTGNWGTVTAMGIFDALTTGNLIAWCALTNNRVISNGDAAPSFAIDALSITLD